MKTPLQEITRDMALYGLHTIADLRAWVKENCDVTPDQADKAGFYTLAVWAGLAE